MKKFLLAVKAWIVAHKVIAIVIAGAAALAITTAVVVPVSVSAAKRRKAAEQEKSQQQNSGENNSGSQGDNGEGKSAPPAKYTITWKDENGTVLETDYEVPAGTVPTYDGDIPTKASSNAEDFAFSSWSPAVVAANADAIYTAVYSSTARKYAITWVDGNGETIKTDQVGYGQVPVYTGDDPVKDPTTEEQFEWNHGWDVTPVAVTGTATYTATFDSSPRMYTITWIDGNGNTLKTEQVGYGSTPSYTGDTPTKETSMANTYTFNGTWTPAVQAVSGNATYTANFDENGRSYHVTFVNYNGALLQDSGDVAYSDLGDLVYGGDTPLKPQDEQYTYTWDSTWTQNIDSENSTVTYTANFSNNVRTYTVTWKDGNGDVIDTTNDVPYGTTPVYSGETPTKNQTATIGYTFNGTWTPALGNITGDTEYVANFDAGKALYTVKYVNWDGTELASVPNQPYDGNYVNDYEGAEPTCTENSTYNYAFDGFTLYNYDDVGFQIVYKAQFHPIGSRNDAFSYTLEDDHYIVTGWSGYSGEYCWIPSEHDDLPVTKIGASASFSGVEHLYIPSSIVDIGYNAFYGKNLQDVHIAGNPNLGERAFYNCNSLNTFVMEGAGAYTIGESVFTNCPLATEFTLGPGCTSIAYGAFNSTHITSFPLMENLTTIGSYAFTHCEQLESIEFGNSLVTISDNAFYYCLGLEEIVIPDSVTTLGAYAFYNCENLTSITFGAGITSLDIGRVLWGCPVTEYKVSENHATWTAVDGVIFDNSGTNLKYFPRAKAGDYVIPEGTTSISSNAFEYTSNLNSVTVCEGITSIPTYCFYYSGVKNITIPNSVTEFYYSAFKESQLETLTIGSGLDTIGLGAFGGCSNLATITFVGNTHFVCDSQIIFNASKSTIIQVLPSKTGAYSTSTDGVTRVEGYAFSGSSLTSITIGNEVTSMGQCCFEGCQAESISIGTGVEYIPAWCFKDTVTNDITLPSTITSIYQEAFENAALTSFTVPDDCTSLGYYTFEGCYSLKSIDLNNVETFADHALANCGIESIALPSTVTSLSASLLASCPDLVTADLSAVTSATASGEYTCNNCESLTTVTLPNSITTINQRAFANCPELTTINIPSSVTEIGYQAFYNDTKLTSVTLPAALTTIGAYAFAGVGVTTFNYAGTGSQWAAFKEGRNETWASWPNAAGQKFVMTADDFNYDLYDVAYR